MTAETLSALAGLVGSLAFSYVPGLQSWYAKQATEKKRLIMALLLVGITVAAYGASCARWFSLGLVVTCDQAGLEGLVRVFVLALVANQGTYLITKG